MFWAIVVVVAIVVLGGAGLAVWMHVDAKKDRQVRENGRPLMAALVMANTSLFEPDGMSAAPGLVLFGFYQPSARLRTTLQAIANQVYSLYEAESVATLSQACREFSSLLKQDRYTTGRRNPVPAELAGTLKLYVADLWIDRERLPRNWENLRALACAVTGEVEGDIALLPNDDPRAQQIYAAAMTGPS